MNNEMNVGDTVLLKANLILGAVAELVMITEWNGPNSVIVLQLTDANGIPGEFPISISELEVLP